MGITSSRNDLFAVQSAISKGEGFGCSFDCIIDEERKREKINSSQTKLRSSSSLSTAVKNSSSNSSKFHDDFSLYQHKVMNGARAVMCDPDYISTFTHDPVLDRGIGAADSCNTSINPSAALHFYPENQKPTTFPAKVVPKTFTDRETFMPLSLPEEFRPNPIIKKRKCEYEQNCVRKNYQDSKKDTRNAPNLRKSSYLAFRVVSSDTTKVNKLDNDSIIVGSLNKSCVEGNKLVDVRYVSPAEANKEDDIDNLEEHLLKTVRLMVWGDEEYRERSRERLV